MIYFFYGLTAALLTFAIACLVYRCTKARWPWQTHKNSLLLNVLVGMYKMFLLFLIGYDKKQR